MSQNHDMKVWEINGISLTLDLENADVMERYEKAFEAMAEAEKKIPKDGKRSTQIRSYCALFRTLYDTVFGEGTSARIFGDQPDSTGVYDAVYDSFLNFVGMQITETAQRRAERLSKYVPNRAARRAAQKR